MTKIWTDTYDLKSKKWVAKRKGYNEKRLSKERRRMIEKRMENTKKKLLIVFERKWTTSIMILSLCMEIVIQNMLKKPTKEFEKRSNSTILKNMNGLKEY
jgi:Tol biopolymer transport system component